MVNLLDVKKEQINDGVLVIDIKESIDGICKIDFNSCDCSKVVINLFENVKASILNVVDKCGVHIEFNLQPYASLKYNVASFDVDNDNDVLINMDGEGSTFDGSYADFSKGENKYKLDCHLRGRGTTANWHLASLTTKQDRKTFEISFYHYARNTYAKMSNYGVCEDESHLSFLGTSKIFRGCKESATHQNAKIMVFDKKCVAKASPSLCIDENDVQASHAAVVGQINEDHVFYLMSRGIEEKEAKKLITLGYLLPILNHFEEDEETVDIIKENIETRV